MTDLKCLRWLRVDKICCVLLVTFLLNATSLSSAAPLTNVGGSFSRFIRYVERWSFLASAGWPREPTIPRLLKDNIWLAVVCWFSIKKHTNTAPYTLAAFWTVSLQLKAPLISHFLSFLLGLVILFSQSDSCYGFRSLVCTERKMVELCAESWAELWG